MISIWALLLLSSSQAQIIFDQPPEGNVQFIYSHWKVENGDGQKRIDQVTFPLTGFVPLRDNLEARFYMANCSNNLSYTDQDYDLSGMSDLRMQVSHSFSDDRFLISGGINMPLGKKKLNRTGERAIIETLSQSYLSFPIRHYGEGFGIDLLVGGATMMQDLRLGGSFSYRYTGSYEPYEEIEDYNPGDIFSINATAEVPSGKSTLAADIIYSLYSNDQLGGVDVFKQSPQFDIRLGWMHNAESSTISSNIRYLVRGKNKRFDMDNGDLIQSLKLYGNEFLINGMVGINFEEYWTITPLMELRFIQSNESGFDNCSLFGLGIYQARKISENMNIDVGFKYYTGSADGGELDLTGLQMSIGLAALF